MKNKDIIKPRQIKASLRPFYRWHRRVGIIAALFIIIISITGILLNHNAQLGLNKSKIESDFLLNLYGMGQQEISEFAYPEEVLTVDRIILDIHNGKILGMFGVWLMDFLGIAMILLSVSGLYMWLKRGNRNKRKQSET